MLSALDQATGEIVWQSAIDEDPGGGLDSSPVPFNGHGLPGLQGRRVEQPLEPGLRDRRRVARRAAARSSSRPTTSRPRTSRRADRGSSIVNTPAFDLEQQADLRRDREPGQPEAAPDHELAAEDRRRSGVADVRQDPGLAPRDVGQLPGPAGRRLADLQHRAAVAGRPLLVRAVRLQLPGVAEPLDELGRAPDVRRAAEVGRVHRGLHRHDGAGVAGDARAAVLRLQPQLERGRRRTGSTSRSAAATSTRSTATPARSSGPRR